MTRISLASNQLFIEMTGWDVVWSLRRQLQFPLSSVQNARLDPDFARAPRGFRLLGTYLPRLITGGIFQNRTGRSFWMVRNPEKSLVIELQNQPFAFVVIEVSDPSATLALLQGE